MNKKKNIVIDSELHILLIALGFRAVEHRWFKYESDAIKLEEKIGTVDLKSYQLIHGIEEALKNE